MEISKQLSDVAKSLGLGSQIWEIPPWKKGPQLKEKRGERGDGGIGEEEWEVSQTVFEEVMKKILEREIERR